MQNIFSQIMGFIRTGGIEEIFILLCAVVPVVLLLVILSNKDLRKEASVYVAEEYENKTIGKNGPKVSTVLGVILIILSFIMISYILGYYFYNGSR